MFSKKEKAIGKKIFDKFNHGRLNNFKWPIMSFDDLFGILTKDEKILIDKILAINPRDFGKKGDFYGINDVPKNMVVIENQRYFISGETRFVKPQYLSKNVFVAFGKMNKAMRDDIGRAVNILSGYRSPAYQLVIFFYYLYQDKWNIDKTFRGVTLPGWSEHGYPKKQAIDLAPQKGIEKLENFYKTKEYRWLLKNANRFGFVLSFPKGNRLGVKFEPWHWHYKGVR